MEIYDTREGLVGLAVGDSMSLAFEEVTRIEDTHAALAEAEGLHSETNNGADVSGSTDALASAPVHAQDEISDVVDEETTKLELEAASDAPKTLGHMAPDDDTKTGESSGSGQGSPTENGEGSALTDEEVDRNDE
ncbi:hypothetical protein BC629DRAFT_1526346 [Irpex lacteus]|nr:hypothetical protein BC629DRAFT_1526346 [Irpex lacteus]